MWASVSQVDDGKAMIVIGGMDDQHHPLSSTQIVRPDYPTIQGPQMREWVFGSCSTSLSGENSFIKGKKMIL